MKKFLSYIKCVALTFTVIFSILCILVSVMDFYGSKEMPYNENSMGELNQQLPQSKEDFTVTSDNKLAYKLYGDLAETYDQYPEATLYVYGARVWTVTFQKMIQYFALGSMVPALIIGSGIYFYKNKKQKNTN